MKILNSNFKNLWRSASKVFLFLAPLFFVHQATAQEFDEFDTLHFSYPKDTIELGKVQRGEKIVYKFQLTNHYDVKVEIFQIWPSCGCTTTDTKGFFLEPGESKEIEFAFSSERISSGKHLKALMFAADKGGFNVFFSAEVLD